MQKKISSISCLAAICSFFMTCSCIKETGYGEELYLQHTPKNVTLEEYTENTFTISWDYTSQATSYTVQLVDMNENPTEATIHTTSTESSHEFAFSKTEIQNQKVNTVWYARVRANFPANNYSSWVYVTYDDSEERAVLITGQGKVKILPQLELIDSTSSSLTYEWSFTDGDAKDAASTYSICLYSDEECKELTVGWTASGIFTTSAGNLLRFTFSGLDASTTYFAKVFNRSIGGICTPTAVGTTASAGPAIDATEDGSAKPGDIILSEDFSRIYHGGDVANCSAAYYIPGDYRCENLRATGMDMEGCIPTQFTANEFDIFDGGSVTEEYTIGTGLGAWAHTATAAGRSGYLKIGTSTANSSIWTPELSALPGASTIKVSFSAKNYNERADGSNADPGRIIVQAISGASVSAKRVASGGTTVSQSAEIYITDTADGFKTFDVTLSNVTPDCRISIGTVEKRALIDNIIITYMSPTEMVKLQTPENVTFDIDEIYSDQLTLRWNDTDGAFSYVVRYWEDGNSRDAVEMPASTNSFTMTGLKANTMYSAQVKACAFNNPEYDSDYSQAVECSTNEDQIPVTPIYVTLIDATSSTLTYEWSITGNASEDAEFDYNVELFRDPACSDLHVSWLINASANAFTAAGMTFVRFTFSGLDAGTQYYARITRTNTELAPAQSQAIASTTKSFEHRISGNTTAYKGDILVAEDFSGLIHGGDIARKAAGINTSATEAMRGSYNPMTGANPTDKGVVAAWNSEFNFFNGGSVTTDYTAGTGLGEWAADNGSNTSTRPGYVKIGGASAYASIYTPMLSALPEGSLSSVKVSLSAQIYAEASKYCESIQVSLVDNLTIGQKNQATGGSIIDTRVVDITLADGRFVDYEVILQGATPTSRVMIGSDKSIPASGNKTRFLLDNVVVTAMDIMLPEKLSTPASVSFSDPYTEGELTLNWGKVENAGGYEIQYFKKGLESNPVTVYTEADATCITLVNLDAATEYSAKVRAIAADASHTDSDWSAEVSATTITLTDQTLSDVQGLAVSATGFSTISIAWQPVANASGYKVSCQGTETEINGTSYTATGIEAGTEIPISVIALSADGPEYNSKNPATVIGKTLYVNIVERTTSTIVLEWENDGANTQYTLNITEAGNTSNTKTFSYDWSKSTGWTTGEIPFRFVFNFAGNEWDSAYLSPDKTYELKVKTGTADSANDFSIPITGTVVHYNAPSNEIFHENFDHFMGGDAQNLAAGVKSSSKISSEAGLSGMFTSFTYCDWVAGGGAMNSNSGTYGDPYRLQLFSREGWTTGALASGKTDTHNSFAGCFRIGGDNSNQSYIMTPAMESLDGATDVTVNFKTAPNVFWQTNTPGAPAVTFNGNWRRDAFEVCDIYVEHSDGTRTTVATNIAVGDEGAEFSWKAQSVEINGLLPTDKIIFASTGTAKSRWYIDEISIIKK